MDSRLRSSRRCVVPLCLGLLLLAPPASAEADGQAEAEKPTVTSAALREQWGIEVQGIRLSAAGYMLDFRYRVVDAKKAATVITPKLKPRLIDQRRQAVLDTPVPPKVGPLRQTRAPVKEGATYFVFFANPGRGVHTGDPVAVALGDVTLEGLIVQ